MESAADSQRRPDHPGPHRDRDSGGQVRPTKRVLRAARLLGVVVPGLCRLTDLRAIGADPFSARLRRCRLRNRYPHGGRVVSRPAGWPGGRYLWRLGQLRLRRRGLYPAHPGRSGIRQPRWLARSHCLHRPYCHCLRWHFLLARAQHPQRLHLFQTKKIRRPGSLQQA